MESWETIIFAGAVLEVLTEYLNKKFVEKVILLNCFFNRAISSSELGTLY